MCAGRAWVQKELKGNDGQRLSCEVCREGMNIDVKCLEILKPRTGLFLEGENIVGKN